MKANLGEMRLLGLVFVRMFVFHLKRSCRLADFALEDSK